MWNWAPTQRISHKLKPNSLISCLFSSSPSFQATVWEECCGTSDVELSTRDLRPGNNCGINEPHDLEWLNLSVAPLLYLWKKRNGQMFSKSLATLKLCESLWLLSSPQDQLSALLCSESGGQTYLGTSVDFLAQGFPLSLDRSTRAEEVRAKTMTWTRVLILRLPPRGLGGWLLSPGQRPQCP